MMQLSPSLSGEYFCSETLHLYDSRSCDCLATQAARGRQLQIVSSIVENEAVLVELCEDGYSAWLAFNEIPKLKPARKAYQAIAISRSEIELRLPEIINFAKAAMQHPNRYLWGGTTAPNYDCSGLVQAAFAASGIWLPRDSYQQAAFTQSIPVTELLAGDLLFFASEKRVNHVALYLGEGYYIHSSGVEFGRNGIGIDLLSENGDGVSQTYYRQFCGAGRVMSSFEGRRAEGR